MRPPATVIGGMHLRGWPHIRMRSCLAWWHPTCPQDRQIREDAVLLAEGQVVLGTPSRSKADLGIPETDVLIFSASRLIEEKGLMDMLHLFPATLAAMPRLHWHIAGDGPLRAEMEAFIREQGLGDRVKLLGHLNRSAMADHYHNADLFWLLSKRHGETFGLVYIEAGWFGCPCVALRMAGVPEAIDEGVSGYFHEPGTEAAPVLEKALALSRDACQAHARKFESLAFAKAINAYLGS